MAGHGGWPMTVFLTPDGRPFYAGTYFPPAARSGLPGLRRPVQTRIADAYRDRREDIERSAGEVAPAPAREPRCGRPSDAALDAAIAG